MDASSCRAEVSLLKRCKEGEELRWKRLLEALDSMIKRTLPFSVTTCVSILRECTGMKAFAEGKQLHACLIATRSVSNLFLGNTLIDMYAKCGRVWEARQVFDRMPQRNIISWTMVISVHARHGHGKEALALFEEMELRGVELDKVAFLSVLKACAGLGALDWGKKVHAAVRKYRYQGDLLVGNALLDMYAKCRSMQTAWHVFEKMRERNVVSWTIMIDGCTQEGQCQKALVLFEQMQAEGVSPDRFTFVSVLKACAGSGAIEEGRRIHESIKAKSLNADVFVGSTLLDMYAKCGSIEDARQVFDEMRGRNVVTWNVMIAGYVEHGHGEEALVLFEKMQAEGLKPDKVTFIGVLRACASLADLERGRWVHTSIKAAGFEVDAFIANTLVDMYVKCGSSEDAWEVFSKMREPDVVSWNAMITGYVLSGHSGDALALFEKMQLEGGRGGAMPDKVTVVSALKACASLGAYERGAQVHAYIKRNSLDMNIVVGNTLIDMYMKCGRIEDAREVFDGLQERNVFSWNVAISGYAQHKHGEEALALFEQMQKEEEEEGAKPDKITFVSIAKACASLADLERGKKVHASIKERGFETDIFVGSTLVDMYAKCGSIEDAREVFDRMHEKDVVSWSALIGGYAQHGHGQEALELFKQMEREGVKPDKVTFISLVKACSSLAHLESGRQIHTSIKKNHHDADGFMGNALIDMYLKCGSLEEARHVFDEMQKRDALSWNLMITGYAQQGSGKEAFVLFEQMQSEGLMPDKVTFVGVLQACSSQAALDYGKKVHASIKKKGFEADIFVGSTLLDMYAKCGSIEDARQVFNRMLERDVVSWSVMIGAYAQNGNGQEALALFEQMQWEGVSPDKGTFVSIVKACTSLASLEGGREVHAGIKKTGLERDVLVGNALVDMYAKCGSIEDARQVFDKISERNVVSWTSIIAGYAQHGDGKESLALFEQMQQEGVKPNEVTFISILSACCHAGLVEDGRRIFDCMSRNYGILPRAEHYACMVDLFGRTGHLVEAEDFVKKMPIEPDVTVWMSLLGACRIHGNVGVGRHAFERIVKLEPESTAAYVLLSNVYAAVGRWDEVADLRKKWRTLAKE